MVIEQTAGWEDYELLDSGSGMRLERFGRFTIARPDPQCIWKPHRAESLWTNVHARYDKEKKWILHPSMVHKWQVRYKHLTVWAKLTPFKHTGIFPEQSVQWEWMSNRILQAQRPVSILNLFAYTGMATLVAASSGAQVTHVDASRPSIEWAKENQTLSHISSTSIRWIVDDVGKFVEREIRRQHSYDGIILDPPVYGHGPSGEPWDFYKDVPKLLSLCAVLLTKTPLFILINGYAISASSLMLENLLRDVLGNKKGIIRVGELALQEKSSSRLLSTGIFGKWESEARKPNTIG